MNTQEWDMVRTLREVPSQKGHLGLMECPLRRNTAFFTYDADDPVMALQKAVGDLWGQPESVVIQVFPGLEDLNEWVLLCRDQGGCYAPMFSDETIPLRPPKTNKNEILSLTHKWAAEEQSRGITGTREILQSIVNAADIDPEAHVDVQIDRQYEVPLLDDSAIHVLVLALVKDR